MRDTVIEHSFDIEGRELNNWTLIYIDDLNIGEVHALEKSKKHLSVNKEVKTIHAKFCENKFENIKRRADNIGMVINADKTQLLCVSDNNFCEVKSYLIADDKRVDSVDSLKILGFVFDSKPNVSAHVNYCISKFNKALWALTHIRRANIKEDIMLEVYKVILRPLLEYCAPVYSSMLTLEQIDRLEKQQKRALSR